MENPNNLFKKLSTFLITIFIFLFPLAFFTLTSNVFDTPKKILLFSATLLIMVVWAAATFVQKRIPFTVTLFTLPLIIFSLANLLSAFFSQSQIVGQLYGRAGTILAFTIIFITVASLAAENSTFFLSALTGSAFVTSWLTIFAYLEFLPKILRIPLVSSKAFSPLGTPLATASFLIIVLAVTLLRAIRTKDALVKTVLFVASSVESIAVVFLVSLMLPGQTFTPSVLPFSAGWSIAVDMLKTAKTALLGVGPDNFIGAYTRFKPLALNSDKLWTLRFTASSNELFTIITTLGLLGLIPFLWLTFSMLKNIIGKTASLKPEIRLGLGLVLLSYLLIPANLATWFLTFVFLTLATGENQKKTIGFEEGKAAFLPKAISVIVFALSLVGSYALLNFVKADLAFAQSLKAASENKGAETYNLQIKALKLNPYEVAYRLAYSNTNLALANSLASKESLESEDKKNISQLITQAIREAKAAVSLNPKNVASWENLAKIYRNLINFAQGADKWTVASYIEAIKLDPINPQLRLDLGGLFYSLGQYDNALDQFKKAAEFKPDYANAYYNLSAAYKQKADNLNAFLAMQQVANLIDKDSQDFEKATVELAELKKLLPENIQTATAAATKKKGELNKPQPLPSPKPTQVKFNPQEQERLAPPQNEETPPSPTPSPIPTPTASPIPSPSPTTPQL